MPSASGSLGPLAPESDPFRHLRGWQALAANPERRAQDRGQTIIAYDRQSAALLHWHLRDAEGLDIVLPRFGTGQGNHYHRTYPLDASAPALAGAD